jgi:DNA-binding transcriptional LysR family regulator
LTPEGSAFLKLAKEFYQEKERFEFASHNLKNNFSSVLRVGFSGDFPISGLLSAADSMAQKYPNLLIEFSSYSKQTQILPELIGGSIDVAFAFRSELGQVARLNYEIIAENYIAVILSNRHRLWGRACISPEDLRWERVYIPVQEMNPGSFNATINYLQKFNILLQGNSFDKSIEEQLLRTARGDCVSLSHMYSSDLIHCIPGSFARIPISGSNIQSGDLTVAYGDSTPEIMELINCFRQSFPPIVVE